MRFGLLAAIVVVAASVVITREAWWPSEGTSREGSPRWDVEAVTARVRMPAGWFLDPPPTDGRPRISPTARGSAALQASAEFRQALTSSDRLNIRLGTYAGFGEDQDALATQMGLPSGSRNDPNQGEPVYVISGDNLVACTSTGGPPTAQGATPSPPAHGMCEWTLTINADTGEFLGVTLVSR